MPHAESSHYNLESLRSERLRLSILLGIILLVLVLALVRSFLLKDEGYLESFHLIIVLAGCFAIYEMSMLLVVNRALKRNLTVHPAVWLSNFAIEISIPTTMMLFTYQAGLVSPVNTFTAPPLGMYYIFIVLSTLHLRAYISLVTGIVAGLQYALVVIYITNQMTGKNPNVQIDIDTWRIVTAHISLLVITGMVCAGITRQISRHFQAALREIDSKQKVAHLERELNIAHDIQTKLLPIEPPEIDGYEIAGWSQPAQETGGDYFDWFKLDDGRIFFSLADVTGHGLGPALFTTICRAYIRAIANEAIDLPSLIKRLNQHLTDDLGDGRFVTFIGGIIDPETNVIQVLSAGHGPYFILRSENELIDVHHAHSMPLGIRYEEKYPQPLTFELEENDSLVLITDGFFEWQNLQGRIFGIEQFQKALHEHKNENALAMISRLYDTVQAHADGNAQQDDLTAVIIRRQPKGE